jgi:DNA-binding CsgD family transcriptional regulator
MLLPGTEIHIFVFFILVVEFIFFLFQIIYYFSRPTDIQRLRFLLLLLFAVYYNSVSGFLPDKNIPLSIEVQNTIAYSGGLLLSFYLPYYIYKSFNLISLKFYAYWGSVVFLFMPFFMCFVVPYYFTGDINLSRKLVVIVPFIYALSFIFCFTKAIREAYSYLIQTFSKIEMAGIYITVIFWTALPIIVYFDGSQLVENTIANAGFLLLIIIAIRKKISESRLEYQMLLLSKDDSKNTEIEIVFDEKRFQENCADFNLTAREREIIHLLAKAYTYKEIAEELFISDRTVAKHISNIYSKTGVSQKSELLAKLEYSLLIA